MWMPLLKRSDGRGAFLTLPYVNTCFVVPQLQHVMPRPWHAMLSQWPCKADRGERGQSCPSRRWQTAGSADVLRPRTAGSADVCVLRNACSADVRGSRWPRSWTAVALGCATALACHAQAMACHALAMARQSSITPGGSTYVN